MDLTSNQHLLRDLCAERRLHMTHGELFDQPAPFQPGTISWDRVRGMMLGLAIGDSLGNTSESMRPHHRRERHGEIRDYLPNWYASDRPVGVPSDDTQLAFWTLEHLLELDGLVPDELARVFASRRIYGKGQSVSHFIREYDKGLSWHEAAAPSAGNGALMRIAPIVIPHLRTGGAALWSDTALCAAITHNDPGSIAACVAFAGMLAELLTMDEPPDQVWWHERYVALARQVEGDDARYKPRGGEYFMKYEGPIWRFVQERLPEALRNDLTVLEAGESWYSGAFLLETVPSVLYILARHAGDPEEAIVRAVNDTKDNDTIAAIVGAAIGALHGEQALPPRWREGLLGRTTASDDGRAFELLDAAEARFG
jgi:ADP-ribosyl-[dinitrogen reductase] hydrolase